MKKYLIAASAAALLSSCINYKHTPISYQSNIELKEVDFSKNFKTGTACATQHGIEFNGTRSIIDAAKNGGIKTVVFVDHSKKKYFGSPTEHCVIVYGY